MESKLLWFITENAVNLFEAIMLFSFIGAFFKKKFRYNFIYFFLVIGFATITSIMNFLNASSDINITLSLFIIIAISLIFYKGKILNKTLVIILFFSIWIISEAGIVMFIITALKIDIQLIYDETIYRLVSIFLAKILFFIIAKIIERLKKNSKTQKVPIYYWTLLFLVPLLSSLSMFAMFAIIKSSNLLYINPYIIGASFVGLLFINVIVFYLFENIIGYEELKNKFELTSKLIQIQGRHYIEIEENHKDIRTIWHDIKNHIICIKAMILNDDTIEATTYLNDLEKMADGLVMPNLSGNKTIDAVLGQKILVSKRKGAELNFETYINALITIEPQDLCALIGNALDNAIDACEELNNSQIKKVVNISISCERSFFKVRVCNPIIKKPIANNNGFATTKANPKNHGLGLKSIEKITNKYSGELIINTENNQFDLLVILSMQ